MKFKTVCSVVCQWFWCGCGHLRFDTVKYNFWVFLQPPSSSQTNQSVSSQPILPVPHFLQSHHYWHQHLFRYWNPKLQIIFDCSGCPHLFVLLCLFILLSTHRSWTVVLISLLPFWCKLSLFHLDHSSWFLMFPLLLPFSNSSQIFIKYKSNCAISVLLKLFSDFCCTWSRLCTPC